METIEILTEITRHQNKRFEPATELNSIVSLNHSKTVTDSLKEYLDNLNNAVVNTLDQRDIASEQEEDDISIQETLTVRKKINGKNVFLIIYLNI